MPVLNATGRNADPASSQPSDALDSEGAFPLPLLSSPSGPAFQGSPLAELAALADQALRLSEVMTKIHRRGWCDGTGGNFSCTLSQQPLRLLMAPSGVDKGSVNSEELIVVDGEGTVIHGRGRASAETRLHLAIITSRHAGAVLHTHSQAGTLLSRHYAPKPGESSSHLEIGQLEMLKGLAGISTHDTCIQIPILANDQDLERLSDSALPLLPAAPYGLLIAGHGLYAWGKDLAEAMRHLEILEFLLEQQWRQILLDAVVQARR
jgi:methylthioribulose-1-phosphate dehydratase